MPSKRFSQAFAHSQSVRMAEEEEDVSDDNEHNDAPQTVADVGTATLQLNEANVKAGGWLKGKITLERGLAPIAKLTVTVKGMAAVRFYADDGKDYKEKQKFITHIVNLSEQADQQKDIGEISVPFQWRIPVNAPPSFKGTYGGISYECVANLKFKTGGGLSRRRIRRVPFYVLPIRGKETSDPSTPTMRSRSISRAASSTGDGRSIVHVHPIGISGNSTQTVDINLRLDRCILKRGRTKLSAVLELTNNAKFRLQYLRFGIMLSMEWNAKGRQIVERKMVEEEYQEDFCLPPSKNILLSKVFPAINVDFPPSVELGDINDENNLDEINLGGSPVCRASYTFFVKLIPSAFAEVCFLEIPLSVY